jgi:hypothetical protein
MIPNVRLGLCQLDRLIGFSLQGRLCIKLLSPLPSQCNSFLSIMLRMEVNVCGIIWKMYLG